MLDGAQLPATPNTNGQSGTSQHGGMITPAVTGSWAVGCTVDFAATTPTPLTGNTAYDAISDTTSDPNQSYGFATLHSTSTLTSGTPFTLGVSQADLGGGVVMEVQPNGTISLDASSPASVSSSGLGQPLTAVTTAAFTPPAGALLVALVSSGGSLYGQISMSVTDSYGLTWHEAIGAHGDSNGYAGIWYATAPASVSVSTTTLPGGTTGAPYSATLIAGGGFSPYTWTLASGSLPAGLALSPGGIILGTPTGTGTSTFTVTATDAAGNAATSGSLSITINAAPTASSVYINGSWIGKGPAYSYGTLTIPVPNADHNWLFVSCSWSDGEDTGLVAYCADDAHNYYRVATYDSGSTHTQIFVVPNAKAATKVYVSTSGFVRWMDVCVVDVANIGPGYVVDATGLPPAGPGSSFTLNAAATAADFAFSAGMFSGAPGSVPQSGTGATWTAISGGTNGNASGGTSQAVSWATTTGPASLSMTYTSPGGSRPLSGGMVLVKQSQPAPVNSNPAWPVISVQAAFGYQPGSPNGLPNWTDISSRFLALSGPRGRSFELDELSAADMDLTLDNFDGALTPGNLSSPYGNVTLITPIQVLATWQGRTHCLYTGVITANAQSYQFERSVVKLSVSDDYSKLPQVLLPSCMVAEQMYDNPLHLWPLNEPQAAGQANNWSGRSTDILVPVNSKYGAGVSGNTPTTGFGNAQGGARFPFGLQGTSDTTWGNYGAVVGSNYVKGTALSCRGHISLPLTTTGATYEVWAQILNNAANLSSRANIITLTDDKGTGGGGCFFRLSAQNTGTVNSPKTSFTVLQKGVSWAASHALSTVNLFDNGWHHYAITVSTGSQITVYIDGVQVGQFTGTFPAAKPTRLQFGGDVTVNPVWSGTSGGGFFSGSMANAAVYDRVIDPERLAIHYNSGANGFNNETTGSRIQRVLTYARWSAPQAIEPGVSHMQVFNYLGNGYGSSGLTGAVGNYGGVGYTAGGGYIDNGAQADVTIADIAASEVGMLIVGADGTLSFRGRNTTLNTTSKGSLGDRDYALNQVTTFADGLGPWASLPTSCTITTSTSWSYCGGASALITVTGTPTLAYVQSEAVAIPASGAAGASGWFMAPTGCYVSLNLNWYGASGYISTGTGPSTWCPAMTPVFLNTGPLTAPGGATTVRAVPTIDNSPATGTQLHFDHTRLSPSVFEVPYNGDVEIIEDIQYLFNDIMVTRNVDQSTYRVKADASRAQYYPRVYTRTIYTSTADPQAVVDCANWLISSYANPQTRITRVVVDAATNPEAWDFVLGTDIGDLVTFERNPVQGGRVSGSFIVLSIEPSIEPDKAEFTYVLAPAAGLTVLTLDDPVYGVLGNYDLVW